MLKQPQLSSTGLCERLIVGTHVLLRNLVPARASLAALARSSHSELAAQRTDS